MKTLLVSGCSVTHGTELYNDFAHPNNVELSFSRTLANQLSCDLLNVALPAASNGYIFHSLMREITVRKNLHSVIAVWTSTGRLYWNTNGRHYFIMGNFASSMTDPVNFEMHDKNFRGCWFTGDNDEIVDKLATAHRFFVTDYFDLTRENEELQHYKESISAICAIKNIPFISLNWV